MKREWRDIPGYEGLYQVSNMGEVKSLKRNVKIRNKFDGNLKEKILKSSINSNGYAIVKLYKEQQKKTVPVHKLVALTFIKNNDKKPHINHIDGNKSNNKAINLEWCTNQENIIHAYKNHLNKAKKYYLDKNYFLQRADKTYKEMAAELGCDAHTIGRIARKLDIYRQRKRSVINE